jgi:ATP-binding protein involved in chromosome partitioning
MLTKEKILEELRKVTEPELKKDIVELDLVKDLEINDGKITLKVLVNNPAMHYRKRMQEAVEFTLTRSLGKDVEITCVVEPLPREKPESPKVLPKIKNIVAVASGKGGVGKSTVTANLAVGLAKKGYKVGIIDADIYGPSMHIMLDCIDEKPTAVEIDGKTFLKPVENFGVKMLSIGFFSDMNQAIVWRGPMASKALRQMVMDADWGELDYMFIDMPPGTGDIHLTLVQLMPITGAIIVTTPQEIALADAKKGAAMFQLDSVKVPVLGIVENMSWFTPAELPENKYYIFGKDGGKGLAEQLGIRLLGQIPLIQSVRESGDVGRPAVLQSNTLISSYFEELALNVEEAVKWRNDTIPKTEIVKVS